MTANKRFEFSKKTTIVIGVIVLIVAVCVTIGVLTLQRNTSQYASTSGDTTEKPSYETILPSNKNVDQLGGWTRISPPENDPVYAYTDSIGNVSINVSQQPLPAAFKNNLDTQVSELAKKFNATTKLEANDTTAYIGTSAKGPQSVIFAKNDLLILIKSEQKIDDSAWAKYIDSLR
jgi:hypothetical protein